MPWRKAAGVRPAGYRAPWWELNWHSATLLADRGFLYDSSLLDGDAPYRFSVAEGDPRDLVEIPVDWALDDWEQYAFYPGVTGSGVIESPAKVLEMWTLEAEAHHAAGSCFVLTNHPFISGRPSKAVALEQLMDRVKSHGRHVGHHHGEDRAARRRRHLRGAHPHPLRGAVLPRRADPARRRAGPRLGSPPAPEPGGDLGGRVGDAAGQHVEMAGGTRKRGAESITAATTRPRWSRTGAATPTSSTEVRPSLTAKPCSATRSSSAT